MKKIHLLNIKILTIIIFLIFGAHLFFSTPLAIGGDAGNIYYRQQNQQRIRAQYNLIKSVQKKLIENNYDPGPVDGINGSLTQKALKAYQKDHGLIEDGIPGIQTLKSLGLR